MSTCDSSEVDVMSELLLDLDLKMEMEMERGRTDDKLESIRRVASGAFWLQVIT